MGFFSSFGKFTNNLGTGALKGIGSSISTIGEIGDAAMSKTVGAAANAVSNVVTGKKTVNKPIGIGGTEKTLADVGVKNAFTPTNFGQKLGFGAEQLAEFFLPEAAVSKAGKAIELGSKAGKAGKAIEAISKAPKAVKGAVELGGRMLRSGLEQGSVTGVQQKGLKEGLEGGAIAAAIPLAGAALSKPAQAIMDYVKPTLIKPVVHAMGEFMTGIEKPVIQRWAKLTKDAPEVAQGIIKHITENPDNPFVSLARSTAGKINSLKTTARGALDSAMTSFSETNPGAKFDVSQGVGNIADALTKDFPSLGLKAAKDAEGKATGAFHIVQKGKEGKVYGLDKKETELLNGLIDTVRNAKDESIHSLMDLEQEFSSVYRKVDDSGGATKFHALVMAMKDATEKKIDEMLPGEVKDAVGQYRQYHKVMEDVGRKIVDEKGNVLPSAESFLKNLMNKNKGIIQKGANSASSVLEGSLTGQVQMLNDAVKLTQKVPATVKNRTMDFVRGLLTNTTLSSMVGGAGLLSHNPLVLSATVPMVLAHIYSSPNMYRGLIESLEKPGSLKGIIKAFDSLPQTAKTGIRTQIRNIIQSQSDDETGAPTEEAQMGEETMEPAGQDEQLENIFGGEAQPGAVSPEDQVKLDSIFGS